MAVLNMNLSNYDALDVYRPLPPGDYPVAIVDSEIKETKTGDQQVVFTYEIQEGEHRGESVFDRLSLWSADPKVANFAQRRLKTIAIACGHRNPNMVSDTSEFHGHYMFIKCGAPREYNGKEYTNISGYADINSKQAAGAQAQTQAQAKPNLHPVPPPQAPASTLKPWE